MLFAEAGGHSHRYETGHQCSGVPGPTIAAHLKADYPVAADRVEAITCVIVRIIRPSSAGPRSNEKVLMQRLGHEVFHAPPGVQEATDSLRERKAMAASGWLIVGATDRMPSKMAEQQRADRTVADEEDVAGAIA